MLAMTAASPSLPIPCYAKVTNLENGKSVIVKVNDRGPFAANRIMDLSYAAAKKLGYANKGTAHVQVTTIDTDSIGHHAEIRLASNTQLHHSTKSNAHHVMTSSSRTQLAANTQLHKKNYYVQLAAFHDRTHAESLRAKVSNSVSVPVTIAQIASASAPLYRVQVGPLASENESAKLISSLQAIGVTKSITITA
jgi:rare lipoprotein A